MKCFLNIKIIKYTVFVPLTHLISNTTYLSIIRIDFLLTTFSIHFITFHNPKERENGPCIVICWNNVPWA